MHDVGKNLVYGTFDALGLGRLLLRRIRGSGLVPILNLHRVSEDSNDYWPPMHPQIFERLVSYIADNFQVVVPGEILSGSKPAVILSFDDGYADFAETALPILEKYGVRANLNVVPQCVYDQRPIWNVRLYDFLNSAPTCLLNEIKLPGFVFRGSFSTRRGKMQFGLQISRFLKQRPRTERQPLWDTLEEMMSRLEVKRTRMLTLDEVKAIAKKHHVGAHSFRHDSMRYESLDYFAEDLQACEKFFAEELHTPLLTYAFPNGEFTERQIEFAVNRGVKNVLLVEEKLASSTTGVMPRLTIYGSTFAEAKLLSLGLRSR